MYITYTKYIALGKTRFPPFREIRFIYMLMMTSYQYQWRRDIPLCGFVLVHHIGRVARVRRGLWRCEGGGGKM